MKISYYSTRPPTSCIKYKTVSSPPKCILNLPARCKNVIIISFKREISCHFNIELYSQGRRERTGIFFTACICYGVLGVMLLLYYF